MANSTFPDPTQKLTERHFERAFISIMTVFGFLALLTPNTELRLVLVVVAGFVSGIALILAAARKINLYHPFYNHGYRSWILAAPWQSQQPLPLGNPLFTLRDLLLLFGVILVYGLILLILEEITLPDLLYSANLLILPVFALYFLVYFLSYLQMMIRARLINYVYLLLYIILLFMLFFPVRLGAPDFDDLLSPWTLFYCAMMLVILVAVVQHAHPKILDRLLGDPDHADANTTFSEMIGDLIAEKYPDLRLQTRGGLLRRLAPLPDTLGISEKSCVLFSMLIALIVLVFATHFSMKDNREIHANSFLVVYAIFVSFVRTALYITPHWMPISIPGRFRSGRLLIPSYDRLFIAPLLAFGFGWFWSRFQPLSSYTLPPGTGYAIAYGLVTWMILRLGPTLRDFHMTAETRISMLHPRLSTQQQQLLNRFQQRQK